MKRNFIYSIAVLFLIFTGMTTYAAEEKYTIDPQHSFVVWRINHLGFSTQTGKWPAKGYILLDAANPAKSKVDVVIQIDDMVTGLPELNKHLEGPQFFDSQKFPTATFVSNKVISTSKDTAKVDGTLTLHGVSKPIQLTVTLNKVGKNPVSDKMNVGFSASTELNRSDFDVKGFLPVLSDSVKLNIDVEAQKDSK